MYNDHKGRPLHIIFPKTSAYIKSYDGQTKWMYFFFILFLIIFIDLLEKYSSIWDKVSTGIKKECDNSSNKE